MRMRDLVVVLDGSARSDAVLGAAIGVARRLDAHLTGLCPLEMLVPADLGLALVGYPAIVALPETASRLESRARERAEIIEAGFRERLRRDDIRGDWHLAVGDSERVVADRARATDLLVLGQHDPADPNATVARRLVEDALMTTGRPLLLIPFAGRFDTIGSNVLLGWNGSREAARAAHDALLLIKPDAEMTVLSIVSPGRGTTFEVPGAEIAGHLARHGLKVSVARTVAGDGVSDADLLLNYAADSGADLLVTGGYGHSRTRELALGGVTRTLLARMTLPVLMSH